MAKQKKFYTVWKGRTIGVFDAWEQCKQQVQGYEGAQYCSFENKTLAELALRQDYWKFVKKNENKPAKIPSSSAAATFTRHSICVDAACSGANGAMEYRGVDLEKNEQIFIKSDFDTGTNNIGEFLAIVHGLAYLKQINSDKVLYSDSRNAILWVKNKKYATKMPRIPENERLFLLLDRAVDWLHNNTYSTRVLKWETEIWGENPADFGRK
ncbi:MAG: ribonuclease H family protein [Sphingobacteriales bacterium]|nr:ribonuclease H family protein [Sphingobacteriales bacterium]